MQEGPKHVLNFKPPWSTQRGCSIDLGTEAPQKLQRKPMQFEEVEYVEKRLQLMRVILFLIFFVYLMVKICFDETL